MSFLFCEVFTETKRNVFRAPNFENGSILGDAGDFDPTTGEAGDFGLIPDDFGLSTDFDESAFGSCSALLGLASLAPLFTLGDLAAEADFGLADSIPAARTVILRESKLFLLDEADERQQRDRVQHPRRHQLREIG